MPATAYSYLRFSDSRQQKGASLDRQLQMAREYAATHNLILSPSNFRDLGVSAFKSKNHHEGALGAFIEAVKAGRVKRGSVLLVESFDRLSRDSVKKAARLMMDINDLGIDIITLKNGTRYTADDDDFTKFIIAITEMYRAHEESALKSSRIKQANDRRRAKGEFVPSLYPTWLKLSEDRKTFSVIPEKAKVVQRVFKEAAAGKSIRQIGRLWTQRVYRR